MVSTNQENALLGRKNNEFTLGYRSALHGILSDGWGAAEIENCKTNKCLDICHCFKILHPSYTVGAIFFENQNACLKSPRMHQSSKSLWPSSRGGPEVSKTPPTCKVWMILSQVMTI